MEPASQVSKPSLVGLVLQCKFILFFSGKEQSYNFGLAFPSADLGMADIPEAGS